MLHAKHVLIHLFFVDAGVCMSPTRVCTSEYECVFGARSLCGLAVTHTYTPVCANERLLSPRKPACCQVATWREREREGRKERGGKKEARKDGEKNQNLRPRCETVPAKNMQQFYLKPP